RSRLRTATTATDSSAAAAGAGASGKGSGSGSDSGSGSAIGIVTAASATASARRRARRLRPLALLGSSPSVPGSTAVATPGKSKWSLNIRTPLGDLAGQPFQVSRRTVVDGNLEDLRQVVAVVLAQV